VKFIDLFAGIGGFRIALERNNGECVYSVEWDKYAQETYLFNYKDLPEGDITQILETNIPDHDILCGGFPCQAFSISGKQSGFSDTRGTLFFDIARIVKEKNPKVIFLENVKNIYRHDNGRTLKTIKNTFDELGYTVFIELLNSSNFGIPQNRQRIFFVCFRKDLKIDDFNFPMPNYIDVCLEDILEDDSITCDYIIHRKDISLKQKQESDTEDLFNKRLLKPIRVGTISKGGQGERIYSPKGHAITLSAYGGGVAGKTGAYLVNGKVRQLSPRECLRVQGFPETFAFPDTISKSQIYQMCGNSVSVPVVEKIYQSILSYIS
jgi:DNA (cytosine-5)-methyltransferase 1